MHLSKYLEYPRMAEKNLAEGHKQEVDIFHTGQTLAGWCEEHAALLGLFCEKYGKEATGQPTTSTTSCPRRRAPGAP